MQTKRKHTPKAWAPGHPKPMLPVRKGDRIVMSSGRGGVVLSLMGDSALVRLDGSESYEKSHHDLRLMVREEDWVAAGLPVVAVQS